VGEVVRESLIRIIKESTMATTGKLRLEVVEARLTRDTDFWR
jgi:hypothetical protein